MNRPPLMMRIRVKNHGSRGINIWLPLFLIFPFFLILIVALAPLALLAAIVLLPFGMARMLLIAPAMFGIFHAMRGLEVDVDEENKERVLISIK